MASIEGTELRQWLDSDKADPSLLIGYHLDDGKNEWLIDGITDHGFTLILLDSDGKTPRTQRRQLLKSAIMGSFSFWSESDNASLIQQMSDARTPLQKRAAEAFRFLLQRGWPSDKQLGLSAIDLEHILMLLDGNGVPPDATDVDKLANFAEQSPKTALVGARWVSEFVSRNSPHAQSLALHCGIHLSALYRIAGRYDEALSATSILVTGPTGRLNQSAIATMCITRAAALMDKFEHARNTANANNLLTEARALLGRSYAIFGGESNEYGSATFGRLRSLEKSLKNG